MHCSKKYLLDHLVGNCEELRRDFEAERTGGSPIDDELDFGGLRNRQIARHFSLEKARCTESYATISIGQVAPVLINPRARVKSR